MKPLSDDSGLIRLSKRMTALGLCSRREADEWIEQGLVMADGVRVAKLGSRVRPDARIEIDSRAKREQAKLVTVLLHKPIGLVSGQSEDGHVPASTLIKREHHWQEDDSGIAYSPMHLRGMAPAGRLDIESTGLLVFTQDGRVARHLIGEDSTVEKEYLVRVAFPTPQGRVEINVRDAFPPERLALLRHGLSLDDAPLKPAKVSWQNEEQLRFVLREGKKRQIRRMCEQVGLEVLGLKRVRIGSLSLGALPVGQWRYLRWNETF